METKTELNNEYQKTKKFNTKTTIIIFLAIIILVGGYLFYKQYTSTSNSTDNKDNSKEELIVYLQDKIDQYEEKNGETNQYKENNNNNNSKNLCECKPFLDEEGKEAPTPTKKNYLEQINFTKGNINLNKYKLFENEKFSFYYPIEWKMAANKKNNWFSIDFTENGGGQFGFEIIQEDTTDFITKYNECIAKCFVIDSRNYMAENEYIRYGDHLGINSSCSENNNSQNLSKLLSGEYMDTTRTGMLPPGGTYNTLLRRVINSQTIKARFNSDSIQSLPVWQELIWDKVPIENEKGYSRRLSNESYIKLEEETNGILQIIIKSFEFKE